MLKFSLLLTEIYTLLCLCQENTPRVSLRLLHVRLILSAHSPNTLRYFPRTLRRRLNMYFPRILRVCRKNEEYAERFFHFQQWPVTSNGQCFKKMEWGLYTCLGWTVYKILFFFVIFKTKTALCVYREYTKLVLKVCESQLIIIIQIKKNWDSFYLQYMGKNKPKNHLTLLSL